MSRLGVACTILFKEQVQRIELLDERLVQLTCGNWWGWHFPIMKVIYKKIPWQLQSGTSPLPGTNCSISLLGSFTIYLNECWSFWTDIPFPYFWSISLKPGTNVIRKAHILNCSPRPGKKYYSLDIVYTYSNTPTSCFVLLFECISSRGSLI